MSEMTVNSTPATRKTFSRQPYHPTSLEGRVALVTGAARGLGKAICQVLEEAGAYVVGADLQNNGVRPATSYDRDGHQQAVTMDVGDPLQTAETVERVIREFGRLDVLINNAAVDVTLPIEELSVDDWDRILRTNLRGPFLLSKQVFSAMKRQGHGQIVNICSTASKRAWPNASAYHATKWGLLGLSHALHAEGRSHNIKVTAIICGGMRTPFLLDRFPDINLEKLQDPQNVAEAIRFVLTQPAETVIAEMTVIPMRETSWP